MKSVTVIGAGLAGCEAAWQLANRNIHVTLIEMRPIKPSPAHKTDMFAELVCSYSLRSNALSNAVGILKQELRMLDSLIIEVADQTAIPAGSALAVDRDTFAANVTNRINSHPNITVVREEVIHLGEGPILIASGPLTSDALATEIKSRLNEESFYFYDAAAPIIEKESIDFSKAYFKSRYDENDGGDYINCPMTQVEFEAFYLAVMGSEKVAAREFEKEIYFEGCMPFEEMARRGKQTLLFGPMKPVGLEKDGVRPFAVVQLRQDDAAASLYNVVGFQTHLTWPEQKRVLQMVPGLEHAEFARYGVMHRNSYLNSPRTLTSGYQCKINPEWFFAGQMTGVEGYVESCASGCLAGINMAHYLTETPLLELPNTCMMGAMANYIATANPKYFQPMNANFGIMRAEKVLKKKERKEGLANQALSVFSLYAEQEQQWKKTLNNF